jgi:hypothetical protein
MNVRDGHRSLSRSACTSPLIRHSPVSFVLGEKLTQSLQQGIAPMLVHVKYQRLYVLV